MCNFIGMEYLAALALIQDGREEILLEDLDSYGINIMKKLKENHIDAMFLFSNNYALDLVRNYSDCFELSPDEKTLKRVAAIEVLIDKFVSYLSTDMLQAAKGVRVA